MASKAVGTSRSGSRSPATQAGTASTTASFGPMGTMPLVRCKAMTALPLVWMRDRRWPVWSTAPRSSSQAMAGSMKLSDKPSRGTSGTQARPPRSNEPDTTAHISRDDASSGMVLSAEMASGSRRRS